MKAEICYVGDFHFYSNDDKVDLPDSRRFDPKTYNVHAEDAKNMIFLEMTSRLFETLVSNVRGRLKSLKF